MSGKKLESVYCYGKLSHKTQEFQISSTFLQVMRRDPETFVNCRQKKGLASWIST